MGRSHEFYAHYLGKLHKSRMHLVILLRALHFGCGCNGCTKSSNLVRIYVISK